MQKKFEFGASLQNVDKGILAEIADLKDTPKGAYNIRRNGEGMVRHSTENIIIEPKTDNPGIDITIKPNTKGGNCSYPCYYHRNGCYRCCL